jgi:ParB family chromosome partitioning protein
MMRLLSLPPDVVEMVRDGRLSAGHARALIPDVAPAGAAALVLQRGMSVRDTERLVRQRLHGGPHTRGQSSPTGHFPSWDQFETDASHKLDRRVSIKELRRTGELALTITCVDEADLQEIIDRLSAAKGSSFG